MSQSRQEAALLGWMEALPDEVLQTRPVLNAFYAGTLLMSGQIEGVDARRRDVERWLDTPTDGRAMVVVDHEEFRRLSADGTRG